MKKLLIIVFLFFFQFMAINAAVRGLNKTNAINENNYYASYLTDAKLYLVRYKNDYIKYKYDNGSLSIDTNYTHGGLLNKDELLFSGGVNSYLYDGLDYWTMTNSESNKTFCVLINSDGYGSELNSNIHGIRTAMYIKEKTAVTGKGTYNEPWKFVPVDSNIEYIIKPSIVGAFDNVTGIVEYEDNITLNIPMKAGFAGLTTINCDKSNSTATTTDSGKTMNVTLKEVTEKTTCILDVKRTTVNVELVIVGASGSQTTSVNYNSGFSKTITPYANYSLTGATVSCTNSQSGYLSGSTFIINNVTSNTKCTVNLKQLATISLTVNYGSGSTTKYQSFNTTFSTSISANSGYQLSGASVSCTNSQSGYISGSTFKINSVTSSTSCTVTMARTPYYLSLNGNGGTSWNNYRQIYYGGQYGSLPTPSRSCYTFYGWYTSPSGGTRIYDSSYFYGTSAVTLYAQWSSVNTYGGTWGSCSVSYISGNYGYGTQYNSCGGSQSCSTWCPYSYNYYDQGTCGNEYYYYSCGFSQYVGYTSCYTAPYCDVYIDNPYPTCAKANDFPFSAWCNVSVYSCSWGGCKSGGSGVARGQICYPSGCLVGVYPRSWCNRYNYLTAYLNTVSGSTNCKNWYYPQ